MQRWRNPAGSRGCNARKRTTSRKDLGLRARLPSFVRASLKNFYDDGDSGGRYCFLKIIHSRGRALSGELRIRKVHAR